MCVDDDGYRIINVYRPPHTRLQASDFPVLPHPVLYPGDFNYPHVNWGYGASIADGECLVTWASRNGLRQRMLIWSTRTPAMLSEQQPKILSQAVVEITTYRVGMLSARTSIGNFCSRLKEAALTGLPQPCSSGSTRNAEIDGSGQFRLSTFRTVVEKLGIY